MVALTGVVERQGAGLRGEWSGVESQWQLVLQRQAEAELQELRLLFPAQCFAKTRLVSELRREQPGDPSDVLWTMRWFLFSVYRPIDIFRRYDCSAVHVSAHEQFIHRLLKCSFGHRYTIRLARSARVNA